MHCPFCGFAIPKGLAEAPFPCPCDRSVAAQLANYGTPTRLVPRNVDWTLAHVLQRAGVALVRDAVAIDLDAIAVNDKVPSAVHEDSDDNAGDLAY